MTFRRSVVQFVAMSTSVSRRPARSRTNARRGGGPSITSHVYGELESERVGLTCRLSICDRDFDLDATALPHWSTIYRRRPARGARGDLTNSFTNRIAFPLMRTNSASESRKQRAPPQVKPKGKITGPMFPTDRVGLPWSRDVWRHLVLNRRIVLGSVGAAGELGHMIVDASGAICRCGSRGCLETVVGVPAMLAALSPLFPPDLSWGSLLKRLALDDSAAVRAFDDAYWTIGRAAGSLANVFNPQAIILGGALSRARPAVDNSVRASFRRHTLAVNAGVEVKIGQLGRNAAALGAVGLVLTHGIA